MRRLLTVLTVALLAIFGYRHPPTLDEDVPLDAGRRRLAVAAAGMFVVCFTPAPISPAALIPHDPGDLEHVERVHVHPDTPPQLTDPDNKVMQLIEGQDVNKAALSFELANARHTRTLSFKRAWFFKPEILRTDYDSSHSTTERH